MRADCHAETLLLLWECAVEQPAAARGEALLRTAFPDAAPVRTLGEQNARLMTLHTRLFGREVELLSHCPACGTAAQFSGDCEALAAPHHPGIDHTSPHRLEAYAHEVEFRLPAPADFAAAAKHDRDDEFIRVFLDRCVLACTREGRNVPARELPAPLLDALSQRMETLDPGASVSFALECPQCATHWRAMLDVADMVWRKVRAAAERLLLDVDVLARAYGWTEAEVLRLNPLRRAAYLQMATA